jgi:hypothetical protein
VVVVYGKKYRSDDRRGRGSVEHTGAGAVEAEEEEEREQDGADDERRHAGGEGGAAARLIGRRQLQGKRGRGMLVLVVVVVVVVALHAPLLCFLLASLCFPLQTTRRLHQHHQAGVKK